MENDLISVIVPIYNGERYLEKCLDSIIAQTYKNLEILLVNDGSTDRSVEICNNYAKKDDRVKLINKDGNTGLPDTRNVGVAHANGKFISFIDCDDYLDETMFEDLHNCIIENDVDIARCKMNFLTTTDSSWKEDLYELTSNKFNKENIKDILYHFVTRRENIGCYVMPWMIKKDKVVPFNPNLRFMEDTEFLIRLLLNVDSAYFMDKILYQYRYNQFSMSKNSKNAMKNILGALESISGVKTTLKEKNLLTESFEKNINNNFINIVFAMVKLFKLSNIIDAAKFLKEAFKINALQDIINNLNEENLPKIKKFEVFLIKKRLYFILAVLVKLTEK